VNTLNKFFKVLKISTTAALLSAGLANSTLRPHAGFMLLDALGQGMAIYVIWFMGGRKSKDEDDRSYK
jgi:hypothetical protein